MCSGSLFAHKRGFRLWGEKGRKMRNRKKKWRRLKRKRIDRERKTGNSSGDRRIRRICLVLLLAEAFWYSGQNKVFPVVERWEKIVPADPEAKGMEALYGIGADMEEGRIYLFRRVREVVK